MKKIIIATIAIMMAGSVCAQDTKVKLVKKNAQAIQRVDARRDAEVQAKHKTLKIEKAEAKGAKECAKDEKCVKHDAKKCAKKQVKLSNKPNLQKAKKIAGEPKREKLVRK